LDWKLEVVVVPVTDIDRAKHFYAEQLRFTVDVDYSAGEEFRVVQLTPPGSACSVSLMREPDRAGTLKGLHLIVPDIETAQRALAAAEVRIEGPFHYQDGSQQPGVHPERADYGSFLSFTDPDGNMWLVQEVRGS
jgi:catechol 2,3-dioxygenase-like lactoylglutathione lyase family enzyme